LANSEDIAYVTRIATAQLNRHARLRFWGGPLHGTASFVAALSTASEDQRNERVSWGRAATEPNVSSREEKVEKL
jgi:hypothetical protein